MPIKVNGHLTSRAFETADQSVLFYADQNNVIRNFSVVTCHFKEG